MRLVADVQSDHMATAVFSDTSSGNTLLVFLDLCYLCHKLVNGGDSLSDRIFSETPFRFNLSSRLVRLLVGSSAKK